MPGAVIVINQPTGAGAGSPDVARRDLWLSRQIELVVGTSGNSSIEWALLDRPPGSAASLINQDQPTATFTPDVLGSYRIQLVTNGGGPGNVKVKVARVRRDNAGLLQRRGWCLPGLGEVDGEQNYEGNIRSWAEVFEFVFEDLLFVANGTLVPSRFVVPGVTDVHSTQLTAAGGQVIGYIVVDPSSYVGSNAQLVRTITFNTLLEVTTGVTAEIKLYNVDTGDVVTGTTLTSALTGGPRRVVSTPLTIGTSPNLPNTRQTYEVQLRISSPGSPGPGDFAICKGAHLEISYT